MKAIIAKLFVQDGKGAEFEKVALELAAQVRANEPGNKLYTLAKTADDQYYFLELYEDDAALAAHGQTDHMKAAGPGFAAVLSGRPELTFLDVVE
ncbi:MAG TPA: putative quinol monooxygenase [Actinomycetota bacterium]|jgi:quinol monooxygenase YgiN|nr:putative quinol monooxygenase [Actinomycetota bacterium]